MKIFTGFLLFLLLCNIKLVSLNDYLNCEGIDDFVQVNDNPVYDFSGEFTVEVKVKRDIINTRGDILVKKQLVSSPPAVNQFAIYILSDNKIYCNLRENGGTTILSSTTLANSTLNWIHIAFVKEINNNIQLYVDGVLEDSGVNTDDLTSNGPITIGSNRSESLNTNVSPTQLFDGNIDEIRIWNDARTLSEIQNNKDIELNGSESGLIGYFNFNHGVACGNNVGVTSLIDSSPIANSGTLNNFDLTGNLSDSCESNWNGFLSTSMENNDRIREIAYYPNPTIGNITVDLGKASDVKTTLLNSMGQIVDTQDYLSKRLINVNIEGSSGIYFLKLESEGEVLTKKILKK